MTHFLVMLLFAAFVGVIFGVIGKDSTKGRVIYGFKVFGEFAVIGLVIAWILYFLPF
jgi:hypothetical protein